jgi:hypothetical protein
MSFSIKYKANVISLNDTKLANKPSLASKFSKGGAIQKIIESAACFAASLATG